MPLLIKESPRLCGNRRLIRHRDPDIGFQIQIVEIAPGEIGRTQQQLCCVLFFIQHQQFSVALLAEGITPTYRNARTYQFHSDLPVGNATLLVAEGLVVGIEQNPQRNAPFGGVDQGCDNIAM